MKVSLIPNYIMVVVMSFALVGKLSNKFAVQRWLADSRLLSRLPDYGFSVIIAYQAIATAAIAVVPAYGALLVALMVVSRFALMPRSTCRCLGVHLSTTKSRYLDILTLTLAGLIIVVGDNTRGTFGLLEFSIAAALGGLMSGLVSTQSQERDVHRNARSVYL